MPVCSYLVVPDTGKLDALTKRIAALPECETIPAENRNLLLVVTDTPSLEAEEHLRRRLEAMEEIQLLMLTFGEIDPETPVGDPVRIGRKPKGGRERSLPVLTASPNRPNTDPSSASSGTASSGTASSGAESPGEVR